MLKSNYRLVTLISIVTCFNLLFAFVSSRWNSLNGRPLIYFEYILLVLFCAWLRNKWLRYLLFAGMVAVDILHTIAQHYHHDDINFILKLSQLFRSSYDPVFWGGILCGILLLYVSTSRFVHLIDASQDRKADGFAENTWTYSVIAFLIVVYILDGINGTSGCWPESMRIKGPTKQINIAGTFLGPLWSNFKEYQRGKQPLGNLTDYSVRSGQLSPSYKHFSDASRQLLVIVESWGAIQDTELRTVQEAVFSDALASKYKLQFGATPFFGSTSGAEARELMQKEPAAYYSVLSSGPQEHQTLITRMKQQGKTTMAFFPFQWHYGNAFLFRKRLGFDHIFSISELRAKLSPNVSANTENQYDALDDEVALSEAVRQASSQPKTFSYVLTINTHMPFQLANKHKISPDYQAFVSRWGTHFPTETSIDHYFRILALFKALALSLTDGVLDEVVIVGDHAAPFTNDAERKLFSSSTVPYLFLKAIR